MTATPSNPSIAMEALEDVALYLGYKKSSEYNEACGINDGTIKKQLVSRLKNVRQTESNETKVRQ